MYILCRRIWGVECLLPRLDPGLKLTTLLEAAAMVDLPVCVMLVGPFSFDLRACDFLALLQAAAEYLKWLFGEERRGCTTMVQSSPDIIMDSISTKPFISMDCKSFSLGYKAPSHSANTTKALYGFLGTMSSSFPLTKRPTSFVRHYKEYPLSQWTHALGVSWILRFWR